MNAMEYLTRLVRIGMQFRSTPIVDDDFPAYRDKFDTALGCAKRWLSEPRPKIVCLCGSTRFMEAFQAANLAETLAGNIVLSVGCNTKDDSTLFGSMTESQQAEVKGRLDELHFRKIDLADEILILNVGGYIGHSTRRERDYACQSNKRIRYLEENHGPSGYE